MAVITGRVAWAAQNLDIYTQIDTSVDVDHVALLVLPSVIHSSVSSRYGDLSTTSLFLSSSTTKTSHL